MKNTGPNQHYVPQYYLKRFSENNEKLYVFDKFNKKLLGKGNKPTNIKNIAQERYFYDFNNQKKSREAQLVDSFITELEKIEQKFYPELIEKITEATKNEAKNTEIILTEDEKKDCSISVAFQALRTRKFREEYVDNWKNIIDAGFISEYFSNGLQHLKDLLEAQYSIQIKQSGFDEYKKIISNEETSSLLDICNKRPAVVHALCIFKHYQELANTFNNHIWRIGINNTRFPLVTSDNPVAKKAHSSYLGYAAEGIELVFPITPNIILIMLESNYFKEFKKSENQIFFINDKEVEYYNRLQVFSSYRFIFSGQNKFKIIKEACESLTV